MNVLVAAMYVAWNDTKKEKELEATQQSLLQLHKDFLKVDGVKLADINHIDEFVLLLASLKRFTLKDEKEKVKAEGLHLRCEYLMRFDFQVMSNLLDDESKFAAL